MDIILYAEPESLSCSHWLQLFFKATLHHNTVNTLWFLAYTWLSVCVGQVSFAGVASTKNDPSDVGCVTPNFQLRRSSSFYRSCCSLRAA